jgi:hypothetical protein
VECWWHICYGFAFPVLCAFPLLPGPNVMHGNGTLKIASKLQAGIAKTDEGLDTEFVMPTPTLSCL